MLEPDGFRTGDQGYFDADGDLFLVGRRANRINMAGMKFFSEEVEAVLDAHPAVRRSRVFAREHAHLGEIPVAEIEPARSRAAADARPSCIAHCRAQPARPTRSRASSQSWRRSRRRRRESSRARDSAEPLHGRGSSRLRPRPQRR